MINIDWLVDQLCEVLRWQLANPGRADDPAAPEVPWAGQRVWGIFLSLNGARGGGFGPAPITHQEIEAYQRVHKEPLRPFELEIIRALDREYLKAAASKSEIGNAAAAVNARPMNTMLFDALF